MNDLMNFLFISILATSSLSAEYKSQFEQDRYLNENFFNNRREGTFVDIGAHDGVHLSNSWFFEKILGWKGICIEPRESAFNALTQNRNCICVKGAITPEEGYVTFRECTGSTELLSGIESKYDPQHVRIIDNANRYGGSCKLVQVYGYVLNDLLKKNRIECIDYLTIDTEGGELDILKSIDFEKFYIYIIDVENNYKSEDMRTFLESKGFKYVTTKIIDDIYVNTRPYKGNLK